MGKGDERADLCFSFPSLPFLSIRPSTPTPKVERSEFLNIVQMGGRRTRGVSGEVMRAETNVEVEASKEEGRRSELARPPHPSSSPCSSSSLYGTVS